MVKNLSTSFPISLLVSSVAPQQLTARRFGFHNLRHSLASFLIRIRTDPKNRTDFAAAQRRQANTTGLHSFGQPGSHGRSGENAYSNSQPRGGPKRTESGLWKDHTRVSYSAFIGLRRRRSAHFVNADCERTETERGHCPKSFRMMVARDGVEPPTPAFSGLRSTT